MTVVLIPLSLLTVFLAMRTRWPDWNWRLLLARSIVLLAGYAVLVTEFLGLFHGINNLSLALFWVIPSLASALTLFSQGLKKQDFSLKWPGLPASRWEQILLLGIGTILIVTAVIAWIAPPNTWDSLNTHLSRVAHWAQNQSLNPYATGIEKQIYYPPFPGISILQSYVMTEGDHWANFTQWSAMVACIIVVSWIAGRLGASRSGQIFSGLFTATLPMGIAQASSTMTDYIVALWVCIIAAESLLHIRPLGKRDPVIFIAVAAGLAINTKPTAFAYILPFAALVAYQMLVDRKPVDALRCFLLVSFIVVLVNAGYFGRNIVVYGSPIGSGGDVTVHRNEELNGRVLISNTLRNAALHAGTPLRYLNKGIYFVLEQIHVSLDLSLTDARTSVHEGFVIRPPTTEEAKAGNPLHALLILVTMVYVVFKRKKWQSPVLIFSGMAVLTFLLLSLAFKFSVFGSRYHLPFFVLTAPIVGTVIDKQLSRPAQGWLGILFLVASWSWLVGIQERPLLPRPDSGVSILTVPREEMYFILAPGFYKTYQDLVHRSQERDCRSVALALKGSGAEYPFWVLLGAPRDDLEIEWIVGGTPSARYNDTGFQPCAAICDESCPAEWEQVRGMPLAHERTGFRLFLEVDE